MSIGVNATTTKSHLLGFQLLETALTLGVVFSICGNFCITQATTVPFASETDKTRSRGQAHAQVYLDEPLKQLIKRVPELKGIRPAADQQELAMILRKTGESVDEFFDNVVDLIAQEEIKQQRMTGSGAASARAPIRDSYLIVRHGAGRMEVSKSSAWTKRKPRGPEGVANGLFGHQRIRVDIRGFRPGVAVGFEVPVHRRGEDCRARYIRGGVCADSRRGKPYSDDDGA
jgi:hypothetical protein